VTARASETLARPRSNRRAHDAWGAVFCGGASRRMGRDKARLAYGNGTLIEHAVAVLGELCPRVVLASGAEARYPELGLECVLDERPGDGAVDAGGPLAGLAAVLARLERDGIARACVLACDMPHAGADVFRALLERAHEADADVCLVATAAGPEPLCAVVHVRCLGPVRAALARSERRMIAFHPAVRVVAVPADALGAACARNLNTPEEYRQALGEGGGA
jgi:molybdopterin-guanine dinucleotide biosynthesis protein A